MHFLLHTHRTQLITTIGALVQRPQLVALSFARKTLWMCVCVLAFVLRLQVQRSRSIYTTALSTHKINCIFRTEFTDNYTILHNISNDVLLQILRILFDVWHIANAYERSVDGHSNDFESAISALPKSRKLLYLCVFDDRKFNEMRIIEICARN